MAGLTISIFGLLASAGLVRLVEILTCRLLAYIVLRP